MKIVITVSPGNSGGGAVHDFINLNTNYNSPFYGHEFRLLQDPDGLLNLYKNFYENFTINNSANALNKFKIYIDSLSQLKMKVKNKDVRIFNKKMSELSKKYMKKITVIEYSALPQFYSLQLSFLEKISLKIKSRIFSIKKNHQNKIKMVVPVKKKIFIKETKKYLKELIKIHIKKNTKIILDQSASVLNYNEIFEFFDDLKIIIVTRDPRSVFYSMKSRFSNAFPGHDIKKFVIWYDYIMKKFYSNFKKDLKILKGTKSKRILKINFEDFVTNEEVKNEILKFIKEKEIVNKFNFSKSKQNAYKAKKFLSIKEQNYIKKKLNSFLQW